MNTYECIMKTQFFPKGNFYVMKRIYNLDLHSFGQQKSLFFLQFLGFETRHDN